MHGGPAPIRQTFQPQHGVIAVPPLTKTDCSLHAQSIGAVPKLKTYRPIAELVALAGAALLLGAGGILSSAAAQTVTARTMPSLLDRPPEAAALPAVIYPGIASHRGDVSAQRQANGGYYFDAKVNGASLRMLFDTGAMQVVLRNEDAPRLGIDMGALRYTVKVSTANGATEVAPVLLTTLAVGSITRQNVPALVAKPGVLSTNLLGQSFLARLVGFKLEANQVILKGSE